MTGTSREMERDFSDGEELGKRRVVVEPEGKSV